MPTYNRLEDVVLDPVTVRTGAAQSGGGNGFEPAMPPVTPPGMPAQKPNWLQYGLDALSNVALATADPNQAGGETLLRLAASNNIMRRQQQQRDFVKSIETIMGSNSPLDDMPGDGGQALLGKKGQMYKLILSNPQMAKEVLGDDVIKAVTDDYLKAGQQEWKPRTKEELLELERAKAGIKEEAAKPEQDRRGRLEMAKLRQEFLNRQEVKDYTEVETQLRLMESTYDKWKDGKISSANAVDQALVNTIGRMLDPGVSIREAEYQRTPANMALFNRMDAAWQRLQKGGVLNNAEREGLLQVARILSDERGQTYNTTLKEYEDLASELGYDVNVVTRGKKPHIPYTPQAGRVPAASGASQFVEGQTATNPKTGQKIIFMGGRWQPAK